MRPAYIFALALVGAIISGCASQPVSVSPVMARADYAAREPIATSLFPSDQAVLGDEAVARILSSKLELPAKAKLAVMKFPDAEAWGSRNYWRDEQYLKLQQAQMEALSKALLASEQILEVTPLPSLMTPRQMSIPILREAAVRMQADMLLVFRVGSDTYSQYRAFAKDKVKAYSTCELVFTGRANGSGPLHPCCQSGTAGVEAAHGPGP